MGYDIYGNTIYSDEPYKECNKCGAKSKNWMDSQLVSCVEDFSGCDGEMRYVNFGKPVLKSKEFIKKLNFYNFHKNYENLKYFKKVKNNMVLVNNNYEIFYPLIKVKCQKNMSHNIRIYSTIMVRIVKCRNCNKSIIIQ